MTGIRILIAIVGLIVAAPFIALNVWGINMSLWVNEVTAQNEAVLNGETDVPVVREMPSNPLAWLRNRADVRDMFDTDTLTDSRYVAISEIVTLEDLLAADETPPAEARIPLYAAARAPARLIRYCEDIIQSIGLSCDLHYSEARENRQGKIELRGLLRFIPASPLGDPSAIENGTLIRTEAQLPYEGNLLPPNDAATRRAAMTQAQDICDQVRTRFGNCVLANVTIDVKELWITDLEALPAGTNPQRIDTLATFVVFAAQDQMNANDLRDIVRSLVTP